MSFAPLGDGKLESDRAVAQYCERKVQKFEKGVRATSPSTPVARRPSPVARRPSPVARRPSPVARRPSPVARRPSPAFQAGWRYDLSKGKPANAADWYD
ncbi:hypothetical protein PG994_010860 [Apiospora phragmitis]|uniref:Uncharacterized protein n=1 Tax=Apiospora phragmitis TaxID=2905665 RepID=A0ABR1TTG5_9PEZI